MRKNLTLALVAVACLAAVVCAVVLLSLSADRQREKAEKALRRESQRQQDERMLKALDQDQEISRRVVAQKAEPYPPQDQRREYGFRHVDHFLTQTGVKGTRHEQAVRARYMALDFDTQRQAFRVAGFIAWLGRKGFDDEGHPRLEEYVIFFRKHPELFPAP